MISRSSRRSIVIIASFLISLFISWQAVAAEFLDPEQAYKVSAELGSDGKVVVHWNISKGYKLYRDRISVNVASGNAKLGTPVLPKGIDFVDPSTGDKMEIYHDQLAVTIPVARADGQFTLNVQYQGCADDGLCYPPVDKVFTVDPAKPGALAPGTSSGPQSSGMSASLPLSVPTEGNVSTSVSAPAKSVAGGDDMSIAKETLESGSLWKIALAFLVFGLLLSFTPCVLPMLPILSSIIVGEGETGRGKSFMMAVAYCLGLALVYTALGVAAGLAGEGLAGALQKPWVLVLFALLMVALSLSMFDVYHLQIPATLQNRLNSASGKLKGGRFIGVFFMGSISALVVGPCVAAPLAGTLVYISQTKNVLIGGLALFSMATGMSVPLLLIGLSAGSLLPKSGPWMIGVKYVFGLLLIAVAIWMVTPVLPAQALLACWGAFAILSAVFAGIFKPVGEKLSVSMKFSRALGLVLLIAGVLELVGAAAGGTNPLEPLAGLRSSGDKQGASTDKPGFHRIRTSDELDQELKTAGKPVMLDFYADWCVSCKELEKFTFSDPKVREKLAGMRLLQVDVTANNEDDRELMKRFGLFGPPGIIFFDNTGQEVISRRIVGFVEPEEFLKNLQTPQ